MIKAVLYDLTDMEISPALEYLRAFIRNGKGYMEISHARE
jgi:hypothetical protein